MKIIQTTTEQLEELLKSADGRFIEVLGIFFNFDYYVRMMQIIRKRIKTNKRRSANIYMILRRRIK